MWTQTRLVFVAAAGFLLGASAVWLGHVALGTSGLLVRDDPNLVYLMNAGGGVTAAIAASLAAASGPRRMAGGIALSLAAATIATIGWFIVDRTNGHLGSWALGILFIVLVAGLSPHLRIGSFWSRRLLWWPGPVLAAVAGFPVGAIPTLLLFLTLGGLDPAYNLGLSDELVNYLFVIAGIGTAAIGAGLAAGCRTKQLLQVLALALAIATSGAVAVFLMADVTTEFGAVLLWFVVLFTLVATGIFARLLPHRIPQGVS